MKGLKHGGVIALITIMTACSDATLPVAGMDPASADGLGAALLANGTASYSQPLPASLGGGAAEIAVEMNVVIDGDGAARGSFHHRGTIQGMTVDIAGVVTCAAIDPAAGRAWIGGVVTANHSTHPSFSGAIQQPGRDAWFRVGDLGNGGSGAADRSSFLGFEGGAGIITSVQYCDARIWPNDANPVVSGNLMVK